MTLNYLVRVTFWFTILQVSSEFWIDPTTHLSISILLCDSDGFNMNIAINYWEFTQEIVFFESHNIYVFLVLLIFLNKVFSREYFCLSHNCQLCINMLFGYNLIETRIIWLFMLYSPFKRKQGRVWNTAYTNIFGCSSQLPKYLWPLGCPTIHFI